MILARNVEHDQTTCRIQNDNPAFLTFVVISLMSGSDYPLISCPLCKSKTLWNNFMILGRNVEQDQMTCHVQE